MAKNWIREYYNQIQNDTVTVGRWIRSIYDYIIKGLDDKSFFYSQKLSYKAITFVENFAHHHEGVLAPQLIKLEIWQKSTLSIIFGIVDKENKRIFREVFLVMARKNGKTLFAAAIAEYMLYCDGEYGARIYFCAPKLQQANLCYDALVQMIKKEPDLEKITKKRRTDIYTEFNNGSAMPLAFSAKKSDGLNISCCIADESASWEGDGGLKFYEVIKSSMGARKNPLLISITTAGYINEGVYDELMKRATRFLLGDSRETRLLPLLYIIDDPSKWDDPEEWKKSNPNLGVSTTIDYLTQEAAIADGSAPKKAEFLTKYCCIKQNSSLAWLSAETVERCCGDVIDIKDYYDNYAFIGIDLSQTTDLTSACCIIKKRGEYYIFSHFWLPEENIETATQRDGLPYGAYINRGFMSTSGDNFVDYKDCFNWCTKLIEEYHIYGLYIGYDRYSAQYLVQDLKSYGFKTDDVYQGDNLWPVIQEFEGLAKDGKIHIGDNDLLKVHLLDSAIKMSTERGRGRLIKIAPNAHIDGVAAIMDAFAVYSKHHDECGAQWENED